MLSTPLQTTSHIDHARSCLRNLNLLGGLFNTWQQRINDPTKGDIIMKKIALLTAAALAFLTVAASAQNYGAPYGKGKAPPPPVVTKG